MSRNGRGRMHGGFSLSKRMKPMRCEIGDGVVAIGVEARDLGYRLDAPSNETGRAHVGTPVTNAHLVCRLLLETKHACTKQTNQPRMKHQHLTHTTPHVSRLKQSTL